MRSFDMVYGFRLMPTLSNIMSVRADAVVVVVVVVVDVAKRRDARKMQRMACEFTAAPSFSMQWTYISHRIPSWTNRLPNCHSAGPDS